MEVSKFFEFLQSLELMHLFSIYNKFNYYIINGYVKIIHNIYEKCGGVIKDEKWRGV
jgi:hypothetical protein